MAKYSVSIKRSAVKEIRSIPQKKTRQQIMRRIGALADEPRPAGCTKLSGQDKYRIRQGDYRIVYGIDDSEITVIVVMVGHRSGVYRAR